MAAGWLLRGHSLWLSACLVGCLGPTPPAELRQPNNLPPSLGFNRSDGSISVDLPMPLRIFSVDYHHVQAPFEIVLWIMLASLAKLGKPPVLVYRQVHLLNRDGDMLELPIAGLNKYCLILLLLERVKC